MSNSRLGVYFGWHVHAWEDLRDLVRRAEERGFALAQIDGDISMLEQRTDADCLDGWTATTALLASTERIAVGSIRLVHHWNAARLAQAAATAERIAPGRLHFLVSIGDWEIDRRFGLRLPEPAERVVWLDETLDAVRALWRGESVTRAGRFVRLEGARVRPAPGERLSIAVAARRPRMLDLVAAHADLWEVNLPPVRARVREAADRLAKACAARDRDPATIGRSMLLFARPGLDRDAALAAYRRLNPWFRSISDREIAPTLACGDAADCRDQLARHAVELGLSLPIVDASGLDAEATRRLLDALAPGDNPFDAGT